MLEVYETMKLRLPLSFRVSCLEADAKEVLSRLEELASKIANEETKSSEQENALLRKIEWYKEGSAYQGDGMSRVTLRKNPDFKKFHQYLVALTDCGKVLRQETVSMVPPLCFPDINHDSVVLDICAAPGSKTC